MPETQEGEARLFLPMYGILFNEAESEEEKQYG